MQFELSRGALRAAVDAHGAELVSLRDRGGTEYIWGGDPAVWPGRNPLLFPIVGNLKNGAVTANGMRCEMPRHGFARDCDFTPAEQGRDFIVLELRETKHTLARYPFPFLLQVEHRLLENGFTTTLTVTNTGTTPLPYCIGGHTAFRCPLREGERFEDYDIAFDQPEDAATLLLTPDGLLSPHRTEPLLSGTDRFALSRALFDRLDTIILRDLCSTGVSLLHRASGHGVRLDFTGFPMVAFWTKSGINAPFLCLEPWHGCAALDNESGAFTDKPDCIVLRPGEARTLRYSVLIR